jgi:hypothetical protein
MRFSSTQSRGFHAFGVADRDESANVIDRRARGPMIGLSAISEKLILLCA